VDKDSRSLTIQASGKEARGSGTASATVKARLTPREESTAVTVETTFHVTGRPAQFGRGVMAEVGSRLLDKFADNLAELLSEPREQVQVEDQPKKVEEERHLAAVPAPEPPPPHAQGTVRTSRSPDEEALDLLEIAGQPVLKRLAPVAGALAALLIVIWVVRRLRR
jgi:hypothetical protein